MMHCASDVCLTSVAYIGPKSRTERPRKTKIGTVLALVTRDWDTSFKVKRSKVNLQGRGILWRPPAQLVNMVFSWAVTHTHAHTHTHFSLQLVYFPWLPWVMPTALTEITFVYCWSKMFSISYAVLLPRQQHC